jgi:hypothetical protein
MTYHTRYKQSIITRNAWCWLSSTLMEGYIFKLLILKGHKMMFEVAKRITFEGNIAYT